MLGRFNLEGTPVAICLTAMKTEKVDFLSNEDENVVVLSIIDPEEWGASEKLYALREKLNTYISFVESGEIIERFAKAKGRDPVIRLITQFEPDEEAGGFLNQVQGVLEGAGIGFELQVGADK